MSFLFQSHFETVQYNETPNYEGFMIIGAGLPRTGTASMRSALSILLNGPVYHMIEVFRQNGRDVQFWYEACEQKKSTQEWRKFYEGYGYRAAVDYPPSLFYKYDLFIE